VPRDARPHAVGIALERKCDEPPVPEPAFDARVERSECHSIAERERWRQGAILRPRAPIAGAEDDRRELEIARRQRRAASKPCFDRSAAREMNAAQARGQRRRVIRDDRSPRCRKSARRERAASVIAPRSSITSSRASKRR
jgi:hypothetical protein